MVDLRLGGMGNKRFRARNKRKPKVKGNQFRRAVVNNAEQARPRPEFRPRPDLSNQAEPVVDSLEADFTIILYFPIMQDIFSEFARCPIADCNSLMVLNTDFENKNGLCYSLNFSCMACQCSKCFKTSKQQNKLTKAKPGKPFLILI